MDSGLSDSEDLDMSNSYLPVDAVFGSGGHGGVVWEAMGSPRRDLVDVRTGRASPPTQKSGVREPRNRIIVAVGDNRIRKSLVAELAAAGWTFQAVSHESAVVGFGADGDDAEDSDAGTFYAALSFKSGSAKVGRHCIINTRASVDHDCRVDDFAHIAPGAILCGRVHVHEGAFVGAGSIIVDCHRKHAHDGACGIQIGAWSLVRAGTVVQADVPAGVKVGPGVWRG